VELTRECIRAQKELAVGDSSLAIDDRDRIITDARDRIQAVSQES
jgi:hypothetical protein